MAIEQQQQLQADQGLQQSQASQSSQDQLPSDMTPRSEPLPSEEGKEVEEPSTEGVEEDYEDSNEDFDDEDYEDSDEEEDYEDSDQLPLEFIFETVAEEYNENGYISEDTYSALVDIGFPRGTIDTYFQGLEALQNQKVAEVYDITGSQEQYHSLLDWAGSNLPDEDIIAFNNAIDSNDLSTVKLAVAGLMSKYESQEGSLSANTMQGYTNGSGGNSSYTTREEWMKDATDPRYKTDPGYRDRVERKYLRSRGVIGVANLDG